MSLSWPIGRSGVTIPISVSAAALRSVVELVGDYDGAVEFWPDDPGTVTVRWDGQWANLNRDGMVRMRGLLTEAQTLAV